jgi:hypothetical protein
VVVEEDDKVEEELWGLHSHTYERARVPCDALRRFLPMYIYNTDTVNRQSVASVRLCARHTQTGTGGRESGHASSAH